MTLPGEIASLPFIAWRRVLRDGLAVDRDTENSRVYEPAYTALRLRTVCEEFIQKGIPRSLTRPRVARKSFAPVENAFDMHPYKGALEELRDINEYSCQDSHDAIPGRTGGGDEHRRTKGVLL